MGVWVERSRKHTHTHLGSCWSSSRLSSKGWWKGVWNVKTSSWWRLTDQQLSRNQGNERLVFIWQGSPKPDPGCQRDLTWNSQRERKMCPKTLVEAQFWTRFRAAGKHENKISSNGRSIFMTEGAEWNMINELLEDNSIHSREVKWKNSLSLQETNSFKAYQSYALSYKWFKIIWATETNSRSQQFSSAIRRMTRTLNWFSFSLSNLHDCPRLPPPEHQLMKGSTSSLIV